MQVSYITKSGKIAPKLQYPRMSHQHSVKHGKKMQYEASKCVREQFHAIIVLSKSELFTIATAFRRVRIGRDWLNNNFSYFRAYWSKAKKDQVVVVTLEKEMVMTLLNCIEHCGRTTEEFRLMKELIRWYGIEVERVKVHKDFIPQDPRPGLYSESEYCGTQPGEYIDGFSVLEEIETEYADLDGVFA